MKWTEEQKQVIDLRGCNILVSAAAGSGKTAVLIERILAQVTDKEHPVNVDEFVIVTFTRLAAAQMKEKLQEALEKRLEKEPENEHLQRQIMLLPVTQISTIHSFCGYVIQNYFHQTGVDPSYRVANDSELNMVKSDALAEVLEGKYTNPDENFMDMAQMSRFIKSDTEMEKIILKLYHFAMSEPFPQDFLQRMREFLLCETEEELENSMFMQKMMEYLRAMMVGMGEQYRQWVDLCLSPHGPEEYLEKLEEEKNFFENFEEVTSFSQLRRKINGIAIGKLPGKKNSDSDEGKKEYIKEGRTNVKKTLVWIQEKLLWGDREQLLETLRQMRGKLLVFLDLTQSFMERYQQGKREKNVVDFNDLEQMALEILVTKNEQGEIGRTQAAKELSEQFHEIMIDEYQDSNLVQELLLSSVSRDNNRFMVGDIKQSIYRFRMARPDLFLEKMTAFSTAEGSRNRLVFLTKNFRSRDIVLDAANAVFEQIMKADFGGVEYDKEARLYLGADYPDTTKRHATKVDVYGLDSTADSATEWHVIAGVIQDYVNSANPLYVREEDGSYRPAKYGDMAILMRSVKGGGQELLNVLSAYGIPAHLETKTGFFDTREIRCIVSLLAVLDNPRQDIPLVAVMRGPVAHFTEDELAKIRGNSDEMQFYDALCNYSGEEALEEKVSCFLEQLEKWREKISYTPVAQMLEEILEDTNMLYFIETMGNGMQRKANVELLLQMAREFDQGSYQGLYQFVRYIKGIKEREEDFGEVNLSGDKEDVVQIMTIHKSKGLEFPVCFVANMHKKLGKNDTDFVVVNGDMGMASDVVDSQKGTKKSTVFSHALNQFNDMEDLAEELRILYVAMTRAKEKLVLSGKITEKMWNGNNGYFQRISATSYFSWVIPVVRTSPFFEYHPVEEEKILQREVGRQADQKIDREMLNSFDTTVIYDKETEETLAFMEQYRPKREEEIPTKVSVSDLKKRSMEEEQEENFTVLHSDALDNQSPVPAFAREEQEEDKGLAGAGYGTVWHQVMAALSFAAATDEKEVVKQLEDMVQSGRIHASDSSLIRPWKVMKFLHSPLGKEMTLAEKEGKLFREQPFVTSIDGAQVQETTSHETVLVQGIIDGFYETEKGIVLMDYKTDHIEPGEEEVLMKRYRTQLEVYAEALERITGKPVLRKVLYSFSLNKEIDL